MHQSIHTRINWQCSKSVFNYPYVTKNEVFEYDLFKYPDVHNGKLNAILYKEDTNLLKKAKNSINLKELTKIALILPAEAYNRFDYLNGMLGVSKQVRVWILIWRNMPEHTGELQEAYWKNGQKNELNICLNINNNKKITWNRVFSWTESYDLKIKIRNYFVEHDSLDLVSFEKWLYPAIEKGWKRKEFKDFDYLSVPVPNWALITTFIVVFVLSLVIYIWEGFNDIVPKNDSTESFNLFIEWIKEKFRK